MRTSGFGDVVADSTPLPEAEANFRGFRFLQEDGLSLRLLFEIQLSLEQKSLITLTYSARRGAKRSKVQTAILFGSISWVMCRGVLLAWVFPRSWWSISVVVVPNRRSTTDPKRGWCGGRSSFVTKHRVSNDSKYTLPNSEP